MVTFKAHPDVELKTWGLRMVFEHDISSLYELGTDEVHQQDYLHLNHVHESSSSTKPEVQIPYNWYVTEEEEKSKILLRYNWHVTEEEEIESSELHNSTVSAAILDRTPMPTYAHFQGTMLGLVNGGIGDKFTRTESTSKRFKFSSIVLLMTLVAVLQQISEVSEGKLQLIESRWIQTQTFQVIRWARAMADLAELVGWDVRNKPEFREIQIIVQEVIKTLGHKFSGFADDLIGIKPRVEAVKSLLKLSSEDDEFRVVGILGMAGIGKTTIASVLYDKISSQFDASCFIENYLPLLKRVDLSNSKYLVESPNFAGSPRLERLDLTGCINLSYVHPSIGLLVKLSFLSLEGCSSMVRLVLDGDTISNLYSLKVLHLSGCPKLEMVPDFTGVSNLEYLDIDQLSFNLCRSSDSVQLLHLGEEGQNLALSWLVKLIKNPCHFRCGLDIVVPGPHCHFVTTGAQITFKAHPGLVIKQWGLRMVMKHDIDDYSPFDSWTNGVHKQDYLGLNHVHECSSSSRPQIQLPYNWCVAEEEIKPKIQLRYNWHVTEEEENENREVNVKQSHLSDMGLTT
ncbi:hypothetical protein TSUD_102380 [Trifolium subterraneum]|uniref:NB-ARC domain-containing protein n=1 Tax=Trifolium subterraneum TaxID=3900 RepID=A0A2Z6MSH4_TRISU|nr:hypothetical protein TSUD_102380 [Trifolium subterraneum]